MDAPAISTESKNTGLMTLSENQGAMNVFQPPKLTEFVDMIDLMGKISERAAEDRSAGLGSGGAMQTSGQQAGSQGDASARDAAIAVLPAAPTMKQKLVSHIHAEIHSLNKRASSLSRRDAKGSAYELNELYKKIRTLSNLIAQILEASADIIRRFYIALFVDHQPILTGDSPVAGSGK